MSSRVFSGRRSDRLAVLLDEAAGQRRRRRRTDLDEELADLVQLASQVSSMAAASEPDPQFRDALRACLLDKIEREGIGLTAAAKTTADAARAAMDAATQAVRRVPARTGRTRVAVLVGVTAGALVLSGVSAASTNTLPGHPLYQVKRSSELAQLALAGSEESRGQLYLELAAARLDEAERATSRVEALLADMDVATVAGVSRITSAALARRDPSALEPIAEFVSRQRPRLVALSPTANPTAAQRIAQSMQLLSEVDNRLRALRTALASGCFVASLDELGPSPNC